jgi:hypothetical protein
VNPASASLPPVAPAPVRHRLALGGGLLVLLAVLLVWSWDRGEPTAGERVGSERTTAALRSLTDPQVQADPGRRAAAAAQALEDLARDLAPRDAIDRVVRVQELSTRYAVALRLEPADAGSPEAAGPSGVAVARALDGGRRWAVAVARADSPPGPADLVVLELPRAPAVAGGHDDPTDASSQGSQALALVLAGVLAGLLLVWRLNRTVGLPRRIARPPMPPPAPVASPQPSPSGVAPGPSGEAPMPDAAASEPAVPAADRPLIARSVIATSERARASATGWSAAWATLSAPMAAPTVEASVVESTAPVAAPSAPTAETVSHADAGGVRRVAPYDPVDPGALMAASLDLAPEVLAPPESPLLRADAAIASPTPPLDAVRSPDRAEPAGEQAGEQARSRAVDPHAGAEGESASDALLALLDLAAPREAPREAAQGLATPDLTPLDVAGLLRREVDGWARRAAPGGRSSALSPPIVPEFALEPGVVLPAAADERLLPLAVRALLQQAVARAHAHVAVHARTDEGAMLVWVDDDGGAVWRDTESGFGFGLGAGGMGRSALLDPDRLGVALALAHRVARWHGGDIALGDSPLGGRRVTLRWPLGLQDWGDLERPLDGR